MQLGDFISMWSTQVAMSGFPADDKGTRSRDLKESTDKHGQTHLGAWSPKQPLPQIDPRRSHNLHEQDP